FCSITAGTSTTTPASISRRTSPTSSCGCSCRPPWHSWPRKMATMRDKADTMKSLGRVLRRQVTIQRSTVEYTEAGDPREAWEDWQVVWAERQNLWGQEYYAAKAAGEENTIVFVVRYGPYIEQLNTVDFRLVEGGKIYG